MIKAFDVNLNFAWQEQVSSVGAVNLEVFYLHIVVNNFIIILLTKGKNGLTLISSEYVRTLLQFP